MFIEHLADAFLTVFALKNLLLLAVGTIAGIVIGAIPGLTITMAVILVLPFTFAMTPIEGLSTILGVLVGGLSGGLYAAVLLGIPGTPGAVASTFDGYPMARQGKAGLALGIGVWASFFGGVISAVLLIFVAVPLSRIGLEFGPWEYFSLLLFALTMAASIAGDSMVKGLIACAAGLLIAAIGEDPLNAIPRLNYGLSSLDRGLDYLPVLIGIFAFGQLMVDIQDRAAARRASSPGQTMSARIQHREGIRANLRDWPNLIRSSLIGMLVGILPAVSGSVSNFMAYDQAKKASPEPEKFGQGHPGGIIAPEADNNADAGGALAILMALGIPGDAVAAVMLGALMIHGVVPSPSFITDKPVLAYGILIAFILAHFVTVAFSALGLRLFVLSTRVPLYMLAIVIVAYCAVGAFSLNNQSFDMWLILWFGLLGYAMRLLRFPTAPLILGVVLGSLLETNLVRALSTNDSLLPFVARPLSLLFLILAAFSTLFPLYQAQRGRARWTRWYVPSLQVLCAAPLLAMPGIVRPLLGAGLLATCALMLRRRPRHPTPPGALNAHEHTR